MNAGKILLGEFRGFDAVHSGHLNVHQYHITGRSVQVGYQVLAIRIGPGTGKTRRMIEQEYKSFPQMLIILEDRNPYQAIIFTNLEFVLCHPNSEFR